MSKIIKAMNVMISNSFSLRNVTQGHSPGEYFFNYEKYNWSIYRNHENEYFLNYYPKIKSFKQIIDISIDEWDESVEYVTYSTKDLPTKEARETFSELYTLVKEKIYGMDEILDDIINNEIPF